MSGRTAAPTIEQNASDTYESESKLVFRGEKAVDHKLKFPNKQLATKAMSHDHDGTKMASPGTRSPHKQQQQSQHKRVHHKAMLSTLNAKLGALGKG